MHLPQRSLDWLETLNDLRIEGKVDRIGVSIRDYRPQDGMLIPMAGEAAWVRPEGHKVYFVGQVQKLRYEFLP